MGIKFSWKKFVAIVSISLGIPSAIITIVEGWDVVLDGLIFVKNVVFEIFGFLIGNIGRDILLLVLIGVLFWLIRRSKKTRSIPPQAEKSEGEKEWEFEWNPRHDFIIARFIEKNMQLSTGHLFKGYEEKFPDDSEKEFNTFLFDLEESGLIKHKSWLLNEKLYALTKAGRQHYMKRLKEEKPKKKEEEPKLTKDQRFILALITESHTTESVNSLFASYKKQFPEATLTTVKHILHSLAKNGLIRRAGSIGVNFIYMATDKGTECVHKELEKIKEYRKAIDAHIEISKKAKEF